jgi:hypothetical protein
MFPPCAALAREIVVVQLSGLRLQWIEHLIIFAEGFLFVGFGYDGHNVSGEANRFALCADDSHSAISAHLVLNLGEAGHALPTVAFSPFQKPIVDGIGVTGHYGIVEYRSYILTAFQFLDGLIGPPHRWQLHLRMKAVVERVHVTIRIFRRTLVAFAVAHIQLAYQPV